MMTTYQNPIKILSGKKAAFHLPGELALNSCSRPLLILQKELCPKKKKMAKALFTYSSVFPIGISCISKKESGVGEAILANLIALKADSIVFATGMNLFAALLKEINATAKTKFLPKKLISIWLVCGGASFEAFTTLSKEANEQIERVGNNFFNLMVIDSAISRPSAKEISHTKRLSYFISEKLKTQQKKMNPVAVGFLEAASKASTVALRSKKISAALAFQTAMQSLYFSLSITADKTFQMKQSLKAEFDLFCANKTILSQLKKQEIPFTPAPKYYEFFAPVKIVSGKQVLETIPDELRRLGAHRPMILCTPSVYKRNTCDCFACHFGSDIEIGHIETSVPQDSDVQCVEKLAAIYKQKECDSIIAIGGGSYLDTAKGINILVSNGSGNLEDYAGSYTVRKKLNPLIAVPTTSGTGSEVTVVSVIADQQLNKKLLFVSWFLLPDVAILDSRITLTLPAPLTAATGMDALCHAIESVISTAQNKASHEQALIAIKKIFDNLEKVIIDPQNEEARLEMAIASTMAGIAFSNSMVGVVHTMAHATGGITHIGHGNLISIFLPYGLEYNLHKSTAQLDEIFRTIRPHEYKKNKPENNAIAFIDEVRALAKRINQLTNGEFPCSLEAVKNKEGKAAMKKSQISEIAKAAMNDGSIFYSQEQLTIPEATEILLAAWDGSELDHSKLKKGHQ